jgi:hypothetical protein
MDKFQKDLVPNNFHDYIKPKQRTDGDYPFEFKAPSYDRRSSNSMKAGDNYGTGYRVPVGHSGATKQDVRCLPRKASSRNLYEER